MIGFEIVDGVARITLDRAEKKNALTPEIIDDEHPADRLELRRGLVHSARRVPLEVEFLERELSARHHDRPSGQRESPVMVGERPENLVTDGPDVGVVRGRTTVLAVHRRYRRAVRLS